MEDIGFYTLSDVRARNVSWDSDLQRCELILTDRCNFKCAYCRGIKKDLRGDITLSQAKFVVDTWASGNLRNIRFSGGEPTLWPNLLELVKYTKSKSCIQRIALSTNGSSNLDFYKSLHKAGVNDFSISLDACCSSMANKMAGANAEFDHISMVISELSKITYVTVGVVVDKRNNSELKSIIKYATSLGVDDIRIIPSAQSNHKLDVSIPTKFPILKYRLRNINCDVHVRGIKSSSCDKCHLVKDDMVVLHGEHFPCVIYMREQGGSIGSVYNKSLEEIKEERRQWFRSHNTHVDPICKKNCLDVCIEHNDRVEYYLIKNRLEALDK